MKKIKRALNIVFLLLVVTLICFIGAMHFYPKQTSNFVGYRFYTVLTNSMEPRIPTLSLICTKVVDSQETLNLKKGDIITFNANRFGEDVLITHHFNQLQKNAKGEWCYRTNAEGRETLDMYETKRSDIIGTYMFHVPYVGKLILFLQSKFGFLMYAELFVIWCVNKLVKAKWEEKRKTKTEVSSTLVEENQNNFVVEEPLQIEDKKEEMLPVLEKQRIEEIKHTQVYLSNVKLVRDDTYFYAEAFLHNDTDIPIQNIKVKIVFYQGTIPLLTYETILAKKIVIAPGKIHHFAFRIKVNKLFDRCKMHIL